MYGMITFIDLHIYQFQSLDTSGASSVSLPRALVDGGTQDRRGPFDSVGLRGTGASDQLSASLPISTRDRVKPSDVHHTFTHHLYHYNTGKNYISVIQLTRL